jgi:type II secretory ATPase GspE/PulE/Tfp pilus assembly ATPase PilB-like protein
LNVVSIEDPIEYTFPGITQVQASAKLGFSDALRAMLRQDPDVILLGEIRDEETAQLCFQAASTGHLVLSTLHANSASEVSARLEGLGVSADLIHSCMRFSSAQRLMPKLCPDCRLPLSSDDIKRGMRLIGPTEQLRKRNRTGCTNCNQGVVGRVPLFEYIEWRGEVRNQAFESPRLYDSAVELARKGEVDVFDALAAG